MEVSGFGALMTELCSSKLLIGACVIFTNLGGRYLLQDLKLHQDFFNHPVVKKLIVFAIIFIATRDIKISLIVLVIYILLFTEPYHFANKFHKYITSLEHKN